MTQPEATTKPPGRKISAPLIASFLLLAFLWSFDFPKPMIDDLFYSGAGMHMARGGDFSNPYIARYFPGQHFFFAYPPVHSYMLWGWLKIFGVSAAAATAFELLMYFVATAAAIAILKRNQAPGWVGWLVPLIAATAFLGNGLRSEAPAIALTWAGFAIIECGWRKGPSVFFGLLLMFLAGATAPRNTVFDFALILLAAWRLWQDSAANTKTRWNFILQGVVALAVAGFLFLAMIHFRIGEFWEGFHEHSKLIKAKHGDHLPVVLQVFLALGVVMAFFAWRYRSAHFVQICAVTTVASVIALFSATLGYGTGGWYGLLLPLFMGAELTKRSWRIPGYILLAGLSALLVWRITPAFIEVYGLVSGRTSRDHGADYQTAKAMSSSPEHPILLDPLVARYTFDYRTPEGAIDFSFSVPFPNVGTVMPGLMADPKPQDIYLLSPRWRAYVERSTYLETIPRERWTLLGSSFDKDPRKVYIIREPECKSLRSAHEAPFP